MAVSIPESVFRPRVVAWEMTRRCPLACRHCRAEAGAEVDGGTELDTAAGEGFIDDLAGHGGHLLILTGGEPLLREDFFHLAGFAVTRGLRVVAATCGEPVDAVMARRLKAAGLVAISLSIDGDDAATHDSLRGRPGAFERALAAAAALREARLPFQVNTTVHRGNVDRLPAIDRLAAAIGAATWDLFFLVPTGRGRALAGEALDPAAYEATLRWTARRAQVAAPPVKVTCAPRYVPIAAELGIEGRGCLGGRSFAFVGAGGRVQMCGFLPEAAGDLRERPFSAIWAGSPLFAELRDPDRLGGACEACAHRMDCGGCRARAAAAGNWRGADPCCLLAAERGDL